MLERFPNHTEADVYLWVMHHRYELEEREGHDIGPIASAVDYAEEVTASRPSLPARVIDVGKGIAQTLGRAFRITRSPSHPSSSR
jgi:hypothetical protein